MLAALQQQADLQRIGRERGVAAENAGGQQQPQLRRGAIAQGEGLDHHAHQQRAADVDQEGRPGPGTADGHAGAAQVAGVAQAGTQAASDEDQEIIVQCLHRVPRVRVRRSDGERRGQARPAVDEHRVRLGRSHQPLQAVIGGAPSPSRAMLPAAVRLRHRGRQYAGDLAAAEAIHQQLEREQVQRGMAAVVDLQPVLGHQVADQLVGVLPDIQMGLAGDVGIAGFAYAAPGHPVQQFARVQLGRIGDAEQLC
ncbi:hypothetical protein G6F22_015180 [Rhizopus arrhizus]|nr:hypothetical protein G6F22_015180 [Rhizopus arrhizus]